MTKEQYNEQQSLMNEIVERKYKEYFNSKFIMLKEKRKRLNKCQAWYYIDDKDNVVLMSYGTIVALYDPSDKTLYDFLRFVYGYTSTSNQHIRKFKNIVNPNMHIIWRPLKK